MDGKARAEDAVFEVLGDAEVDQDKLYDALAAYWDVAWRRGRGAAYEEVERLGNAWRASREAALRAWMFVNGGSSDDSYEALRQAAETWHAAYAAGDK